MNQALINTLVKILTPYVPDGEELDAAKTVISGLLDEDYLISEENDVADSLVQRIDNCIEEYPDRFDFIESDVLILFLMKGIIFTNTHWWEDTWPEAAKKTYSMNVNCNDMFAWACADAEEIVSSELQDLYTRWRKDRKWGGVIWCLIKRNQQPQPPVKEAMVKEGVWTEELEALPKNTQDAEVQASFRQVAIELKKEKELINGEE